MWPGKLIENDGLIDFVHWAFYLFLPRVMDEFRAEERGEGTIGFGEWSASHSVAEPASKLLAQKIKSISSPLGFVGRIPFFFFFPNPH